MKKITPLALLLLAACASLSESECRSADWVALGYRDGLYGTRAQIDQYAWRCSRFQVKADEAQYLSGWREGFSEFSRRVGGAADGD